MSQLNPITLLAQVLAVNAKDLPFALAEYDRVRKPDMQALRYLDSISGRIWGGGACLNPFECLPAFKSAADMQALRYPVSIPGRIWGGGV